MSAAARQIKAPTGSRIQCLGWHQEAALRMLMNSLDPAVAEKPDDLIVYGDTDSADRRLGRVLTADPGTGDMRHADAGYDLAVETANERSVDLPMVNG